MLASDGAANLTSSRKLALLNSRFGEFDYIGNSRADLPLLANARQVMVANPSPGLRMALRMRRIPVARTFLDRRPLARTLLKAIRIHQWAKNTLLLAPLLLSHKLLLAGGAATGTEISPWLAGFSVFLFLSLAMVKRFSELENLRGRSVAETHGRGYLAADLEQIRAFGTASATAAVVVFSLYISRPDVEALYKHASRLWLIVPLMLYWLYRVWLLGSRGEMDEDPVIFALRDRVSLAVGACVLAVAILAI